MLMICVYETAFRGQDLSDTSEITEYALICITSRASMSVSSNKRHRPLAAVCFRPLVKSPLSLGNTYTKSGGKLIFHSG